MKRLLLTVALSSALLLAAGIARGRDLPWRTFQEASKDLQGFSMAACAEGAVVIEYYRVATDAYIILTTDSGHGPAPIVVVYDPNPDTSIPPTEYGVGRWMAGEAFPPLVWSPMGPGFDPCPLLYPLRVQPITL